MLSKSDPKRKQNLTGLIQIPPISTTPHKEDGYDDGDDNAHLEADNGGEDEDDSNVGDEELIQMPPTRTTAHHQGVSQPEHYATHHSCWCITVPFKH